MAEHEKAFNMIKWLFDQHDYKNSLRYMNELTRKLLLQDQVQGAYLLIESFKKSCLASTLDSDLTKAYA